MTDFKEPARFWDKVNVGDPTKCWEWSAFKNRGGYGTFSVHCEMWLAHRVAWVLTFGPIPEGLCVLHHCDNEGCCNPYHLFLGTVGDNNADAARKGRVAHGEQHYSSKLTAEDVLEIREMYSEGDWTQQELADAFGVHIAQISRVVNRRTWKHI